MADLLELIEQVGLIFWWDDIAEQIRLQVLRPVSSTAELIDGDLYMAGTLKITSSPRAPDSDLHLFRQDQPAEAVISRTTTGPAFSTDSEAEAVYGVPQIKTIFSGGYWRRSGSRCQPGRLSGSVSRSATQISFNLRGDRSRRRGRRLPDRWLAV